MFVLFGAAFRARTNSSKASTSLCIPAEVSASKYSVSAESGFERKA